jgi:large subunit ribosomal protein L23
MGRRGGWKKAYISIKAGQEINFSEIAQGEVK